MKRKMDKNSLQIEEKCVGKLESFQSCKLAFVLIDAYFIFYIVKSVFQLFSSIFSNFKKKPNFLNSKLILHVVKTFIFFFIFYFISMRLFPIIEKLSRIRPTYPLDHKTRAQGIFIMFREKRKFFSFSALNFLNKLYRFVYGKKRNNQIINLPSIEKIFSTREQIS